MFLDRDGVLIPDTGYPDDPLAVTLLPGVGEALRRLRNSGWRLVVVSNQSGVARGRFDLERLALVNHRLVALLAAEGVELDAFYYCPHHPTAGQPPFDVDCDHRKPRPGMLLSASERLGLRLPECWFIGDQATDLSAALAAGCKSILVSGREAELSRAVEIIVEG